MKILNLIATFYSIKPILPRWFQICVRRKRVSKQLRSAGEIWPIDYRAVDKPDGWKGWPHNKKFAFVLTHDIESLRGVERIPLIMEIEKNAGFRSCFNFVPARYTVSRLMREHIISEGFEVGVHGLRHDGKLFKNEKIFNARSAIINRYLKQWDSVGFRSPSMHHNLDWIHRLNVEYDSSTFDTDPFEPQADVIKTIFPLCMSNRAVMIGKDTWISSVRLLRI